LGAVIANLGNAMTREKKTTTPIRAFVVACSIFASPTDFVQAADLTASQLPATRVPPPESPTHWFVRIGGLGVISESSSKLYVQQQVIGGLGFGPQILVPGRSQSYSNLLTVSFQAGYFVTPNWSLDVSSGIPVWQTARITGYSATQPFAGTLLSTALPGALPITAVYHFTQLGALQPYLGAGLAPIFALTVRDGFSVGSSTEPSVGLVLQGGFDYMLNRNWGVFIDAKKYFDTSTSKAAGLNYGPPVGVIETAATAVTHAQPWVLAAGLTYRF
jgi:outer membrane protein